MTRTRKALTPATKPAPAPPAPPAPPADLAPVEPAQEPAGPASDRDALSGVRDALLREAFTLTSDQLHDLADATAGLERLDAADTAGLTAG